MCTKNQQFLSYLCQKHPRATVTVLMKISYLIDWVSVNKYGTQITNYEYKRYLYGPFDDAIYKDLNVLTTKKILTANTEYTSVLSHK